MEAPWSHVCRDRICLIGFLKVSSCLLPRGTEMREGLMHRALSLHEHFLWPHYISNFSGWTGSGFRMYVLRKTENLLRNIHFVFSWHLNFIKAAPGGLLTLKPPRPGPGLLPPQLPKVLPTECGLEQGCTHYSTWFLTSEKRVLRNISWCPPKNINAIDWRFNDSNECKGSDWFSSMYHCCFF